MLTPLEQASTMYVAKARILLRVPRGQKYGLRTATSWNTVSSGPWSGSLSLSLNSARLPRRSEAV
jgi:hypothetical protein